MVEGVLLFEECPHRVTPRFIAELFVLIVEVEPDVIEADQAHFVVCPFGRDDPLSELIYLCHVLVRLEMIQALIQRSAEDVYLF